MNGKRIRVMKVKIRNAPPKFCTHLPSARPRLDAAIIPIISSVQTSVVIHLFSCIQLARGPMA